jgi:hypothetical protein
LEHLVHVVEALLEVILGVVRDVRVVKSSLEASSTGGYQYGAHDRTDFCTEYDLHPGRILAIAGMRSGSGVSVRRGGDVGEMVRDILLGLVGDIGVVEGSLQAGSAGAH